MPFPLEPFDNALARYSQGQEVKKKYDLMDAIEQSKHFAQTPEKDLNQELEEDYVEPFWRIKGLHIAGSFTTITAAMKTGKSTLMLNLIRSLVDGVPFLGQPVTPITGNVAYLNMELEQNVWLQWARDIGIQDKKRIRPWHLRGERLPLYNPVMEERLVKWCIDQDIEALIIDPGHRLLRGWPGDGGENSNDKVAAVCQKLQEIKKQANVKDLFIPLHTGHQAGAQQHTRGAIMWQDDPDHLWNLWIEEVIKGEELRHFSAEGRNVAFAPVGIMFAPETHRYEAQDLDTLKATHRRYAVVIALHKLGGTANTRDLKSKTKGFANDEFTEVLDGCKEHRLINEVKLDGKTLNRLADTKQVKEIIMFHGGAKEVDE